MSLGRLVLCLMGVALLTRGLSYALKCGPVAALGTTVLGLGLGYLMAPGLRANETRRMGTFLFNLAAVLGDLALDNLSTDTLCLVSNAVIVMMLWEEEGPHLRKRLRKGWQKVASRFARPVISLPS